MDPTALYYALSTIAQCAAALAALIGFLGLWRLDGLRENQERIEHYLRWLNLGGNPNPQEVMILPTERLITEVSSLVAANFPGEAAGRVQELTEKLRWQIAADALQRWKDNPGEQQCLMRALWRFLILNLVILVVAIVLLVFADVLSRRVWAVWMLKGFVILASLGLGVGPFYLIREAARALRPALILTLLILLASPTWAAATRCTTYEEKTLGRLQTLCADGTRAVSSYHRTLERWDTTITPAPGQTCAGQMNSRTRQWEGRCR